MEIQCLSGTKVVISDRRGDADRLEAFWTTGTTNYLISSIYRAVMCCMVSIGQRIFSWDIIGNIFQYIPVATSAGSGARFLPTGEINKFSQLVRILL
jgi:hypothetical protein